MLYRIDSKGKLKKVTGIPHEDDFGAWRSRLSKKEYNAIYNELSNRVEGGEIHTSSWIPGEDWSDTVF